MEEETKDISGNDGVFIVMVNKKRATAMQVTGGPINVTIEKETTIPLHLKIDSGVKLSGFFEMPEITQNPYIGGFDEQKPSPEPMQQEVPAQSNGFILHTVPCADNYSEVWLCDESITRKDTSKVQFHLLLFSLTYVETLIKLKKLAMCNYTIRDKDGKVWVRMTQKRGAIAGQFNGDCGNNHPRFEDNVPGLGKYDCQVYLPPNTYFIDYEVTGDTYIEAWVHHPSTNEGENRDIYKNRLLPKESCTVKIDEEEFKGEFHRNAIKINGNCVN